MFAAAASLNLVMKWGYVGARSSLTCGDPLASDLLSPVVRSS